MFTRVSEVVTLFSTKYNQIAAERGEIWLKDTDLPPLMLLNVDRRSRRQV